MGKTFDVVALGEGMVEFNQTTAGQPGYLQGFGGDTGAGDCFSGNLLACMAQGSTVFEAARYANAAAALAVQGFGAVAPLPRRDTVRAML